MHQSESQSSTTILLVISILVLATIGIGWFALDGSSPQPAANVVESAPPAVEPEPAPAAATEDVAAAEEQSVPAITVSDIPAPSEEEVQTSPETGDSEPDIESSLESDLRKARMAAQAEILIEPRHQSALFFYSEVLKAAPDHEIANAELDAVLGQLAVTASSHLSAQQYDEAYELSMHVSRIRPDHALVNDVQQTIDQLAGEHVTDAMQAAEAGEGDKAAELLAKAESLPGRNARYFQAVRESVDDLLEAQATAEAERVETAQAAAARETRSWMEKVRGAIADGRLLAPEDNCAVDYLNERQGDDDIAKQLEQELYDAVLADAAAKIDDGQLESAETVIAAAVSINGTTDELETLKVSLENAFAARESAKVVPTTELKRRNSVAAEYPRRAEERGISGWVEVQFTVTPTGETAEIVVAESEPGSIFDEPAIEAVQQWLFEPRQFRGRPIAQKSRARLVFKLN